MRILLTLVALVAWAALMLANVVAAGRTATQMELKEGISGVDARHRTTTLVLGWALGLIVALVFALWLIWR